MPKHSKFFVFIVFIAAVCVVFSSSCATVDKLFPKPPRPFQARAFDSKLWRAGDAQTRGEMARDLEWNPNKLESYNLSQKNQSVVLNILGEPDRKTRGKCCGAGGTAEVEVWLYKIEIKEESRAESETKHFQIYFTEDGRVDTTRIAEWDDRNPDYFPRVG